MSYVVINGRLQKVQKGRINSFRRPRAFPFMLGAPRPVPAEPKKDVSKKGLYLGLCNRSACLAPGADWYNRGSYAFYCEACADMLNHSNRHDEFCKDAPLCRFINSAEECAGLHLSPSPYSPQ